MYDHLDDPTPPGADEQLRAVVQQRAGRRRWRRRAIVLSSVSAAVVAVVVTAAALAGPPDRSSLIVVSPTPTVTPTPVPTASTTPRTSAAPTSQPIRRPVSTGSPTASPTTCARPRADCPDGQAGWGNGFTSCTPATVAADGAGAPPVDGMTLTLSLPASATAGTDLHGTVTVTNGSSMTLSFEVRQPRIGLEAGVAGPGGRSSTHAIDAEGSEAFQLAPGESDTVNVVAHTTSCGDTSQDAESALPPGSYQVGVTLGYVNAQRVDGASPSASPEPEVRSHGSWSVAQALRIT
ncbi:MAG: hypothetical protein JWN31_248 [Frankiales bacterium]|nr:hypothetical protein [Frankiales bacterium]